MESCGGKPIDTKYGVVIPKNRVIRMPG